MKKIFIIVEGETEERFLRQVVYSHFIGRGIHVEGQQWLTNRKLGTKGGGESFDLIENHVRRLTSRYRTSQDVFISTMIDLYAFPKQGNTIYDDDVKKLANGKQKAALLQDKFAERIAFRNFIPYVQLHEFETLLLTKPDSLMNFFTDKEGAIEKIKKEIAGMMPEDINETPEGAPSKRIIKHLPAYAKQKTTAGITTAQKIGLPFLRDHCPHFNEWIIALECV